MRVALFILALLLAGCSDAPADEQSLPDTADTPDSESPDEEMTAQLAPQPLTVWHNASWDGYTGTVGLEFGSVEGRDWETGASTSSPITARAILVEINCSIDDGLPPGEFWSWTVEYAWAEPDGDATQSGAFAEGFECPCSYRWEEGDFGTVEAPVLVTNLQGGFGDPRAVMATAQLQMAITFFPVQEIPIGFSAFDTATAQASA